MNVVRICFQASYKDGSGQTRHLSPVLSEPIFDKSMWRWGGGVHVPGGATGPPESSLVWDGVGGETASSSTPGLGSRLRALARVSPTWLVGVCPPCPGWGGHLHPTGLVPSTRAGREEMILTGMAPVPEPGRGALAQSEACPRRAAGAVWEPAPSLSRDAARRVHQHLGAADLPDEQGERSLHGWRGALPTLRQGPKR